MIFGQCLLLIDSTRGSDLIGVFSSYLPRGHLSIFPPLSDHHGLSTQRPPSPVHCLDGPSSAQPTVGRQAECSAEEFVRLLREPRNVSTSRSTSLYHGGKISRGVEFRLPQRISQKRSLPVAEDPRLRGSPVVHGRQQAGPQRH